MKALKVSDFAYLVGAVLKITSERIGVVKFGVAIAP
jgi:hypothetical protein